MEMEIEELRRQRDLAQLQVDELRRKLEDDQKVLKVLESPSPSVKKCLSFTGSWPTKKGEEMERGDRPRKQTMLRMSMRQSSTAPFTLMHEIRKIENLQEQLREEANRALEVLQKEVTCHREGNQDAAETIAKLQAEIKEMCVIRSKAKEIGVENLTVSVNKSVTANLKDEITRLHSQGSTIADLEEKLENVQKSLDKLVMSLPGTLQNPSNETTPKSKNQMKKLLPLATSNSPNRSGFLKSPCSPLSSARQVVEADIENRAPQNSNNRYDIDMVSNNNLQDSEKETKGGGDGQPKEGTPVYRRTSSVNMKKMQQMFQNAAEENVRSIRAYVTELKERVAKLQYQKQLLVCQVDENLYFFRVFLFFICLTINPFLNRFCIGVGV